MNYLIIGGGVAGTTAAKAIRKLDPYGALTIVTGEPYPFYSRIRLIDFLAGDLKPEQLFLKKPEWYGEQGITLRTNARAVKINPALKTVTLEGGEDLPYGKLLIATGATPFIPPIPGVQRPGVFSLRTMADAIRIVEYAKTHRAVTIIGGGLLGLEAGSNLIKAGCTVNVVEFFPRLLPRQMDAAGAAVLQRRLESMGFRFHLGAKTKEITGGDGVSGVTLEDGTNIPCGMALISAGIRPDTALAMTSSAISATPYQSAIRHPGITLNKGIVVNDRMETGIPNIYAAGDPIEFFGVSYGIWPAAEKQGEIAGNNMAGGKDRYAGTTISNTLKVAGVSLTAAGDIDADGKEQSIVAETGSAYRKLVLKNNRIIGAIFYGDTAGQQKVLAAINGGKDVSALLDALRAGNFDKL
ncbi:MAG: NAD(P)/FAD-dependent oxidoreductase [Nitrospinae bacterium]|nr:NAD(P)/FAD-dependent oxidoreductase [Nitrospinota bacterium]